MLAAYLLFMALAGLLKLPAFYQIKAKTYLNSVKHVRFTFLRK